MFALQFVNEMDSMQREMNRLFRHTGLKGSNHTSPAVGLLRAEDKGAAFVVEAALPGLDPEQLSIDVLGRKLTISGRFHDNQPAGEDVRWYRKERRSGAFEQSLTLATELDTEKVEAEYKHGILRIDLPKAAAAVPKKIAVNVA